MTDGRLGMIVCPILEDEVIYGLEKDDEKKDIYLVDNENTKHIREKLERHGLPYTMVSENVLIGGDPDIPKNGFSVLIWMMNLGLHQEPEDLKDRIKGALHQIDGKVDGVALYYGLCGRALEGIEEWAKENVNVPVTICKDSDGRTCDDCICVPLGGTDNYLKLLKKYPGIMYLTPCMACSQDEFMSKMELFQGIGDVKDYDMLKMILDMAGYKYAMKIQTGIGDQEHFQEACEEYARKLGLELKTLEDGWTSTKVADRIYSDGKSLLRS